jgi:tryptophan 2,3-dioxygenase
VSAPEDPGQDGAILRMAGQLSYGDYLDLPRLLSAQKPLTGSHDELLFIIQHQTSELWMKLAIHELQSVRLCIARSDVEPAFKMLTRVARILEQLNSAWDVLRTMTPSEYTTFRSAFGNSSGFQSYQYRAIEFLLGNKNAGMLKVFESNPEAHELLSTLLAEPSVYDEFLRYLARHGFPVPASVLERDVTQGYAFHEELVDTFREIYEHPEEHWLAYETCEEFVDLEDNFQLWRFRHVKTVMRIIGTKRGTGGSSGVSFLQKALDLTFFPELYAVRTEIR